ncbi:MAG: type II CRISPR-associated endonuclease Cas1 [Clostridia bacterium]|nr:type II CRISPR-associated endonuclease Cas1 [Clostridia bacterium]
MSWRVVVVNKRAKLDLQMNYLVIRSEEITKIYLGEISTVMIENTAISLTVALLAELIKRKIKVVFCDEKRNPSSELMPYYGSHDTSSKIRNQINWDKGVCDSVWTKIVEQKIKMQSNFLKKLRLSEAEMLDGYIEDIEYKDATNREGHAAKVYFNALFGKDFTRDKDIPINSALNYGYSIILSAFNREIVSNGYITQIGLFHDNIFNQFNLASDLMEPFRPIIDETVFSMNSETFEYKHKVLLIQTLTQTVIINNKKNDVNNAIKVYCKSVFDAIENKNIKLIKFYET